MEELIERHAETRQVESFLGAVAAGRGGSFLLHGTAGIGKTALVRRAHRVALARGFTVLTSCPTPVSTVLTHGVLRDWLVPLVRLTRPGSRPFDGPAAPLADNLLAPTARAEALPLAQADYALSWVLESIADSRPVLLVVDDLQWADVASLQLLDLLSARLDGSRTGLLLARRSETTSPSSDGLLGRLARRSTTLEPRPLTVRGVEQMRRQALPPPAAGHLPARDLHELTGGIPFLVAEVLRSGELGRVPRPVVDFVRDRLALLDEDARRVATATAALGDEATHDALAELTGLTVAGLADPLELLAEMDIVNLGRWQARMAHPLVAEAILSALTPSERSDLHRSVAAHLERHDQPVQLVASHLVHTLPGEDPTVVATLRTAGEQSLTAGAPDVAARQLLRAVGETRPEDTGVELLALTASAHVLAGHRDAALDLWERAKARSTEPEQLAMLLADVGDVLMTMGERGPGADSYREAVAALSGAGHDSTSPSLRKLLVRMGTARALYDGARAEIGQAVARAYAQPRTADTHTDRLLFGMAASDVAVRGEDHRRARDLALRAMGTHHALLEEETPEGIGFYVASGALSWADAYEENLHELDAAVEESRRRGSVVGFAMASYCRGLVHQRQGHLRQAVEGFQRALQLREQGWPDFGDHAVAGAAFAYVELGDLAAARSLEPQLRRAAGRGQFVSARPLLAAGLVRASMGDHETALEDYRDAADLMGRHPDNPSIIEWRELSAWSLMALGRTAEARDLAVAAEENARRWGAPRSLGFALRTRARLSERDEAVSQLREAVGLLEAAGCVDHLARARLDLATHLLAGGAEAHAEGVGLVRAALQHGRTADVPPVERLARRVLGEAGVDDPGPEVTSAPRLTPGEQRVAALAASGCTNRQIAQELFVTVKAVEWHLSHAYRKLGIRSRGELPGALYGESPPSSSSDM